MATRKTPVSIRLQQRYRFAEHIRQEFPQVWALGGNVRGNESYDYLARVVRRGYWLHPADDGFIRTWKAWKARHHNHTRIRGMIASLKWLHVPAVGAGAMRRVIRAEIERQELMN